MLDKKDCHKEVLSSHIVLVRDPWAVGKEPTNCFDNIQIFYLSGMQHTVCYIDPMPKKSQ